jgi:hypothetical protein
MCRGSAIHDRVSRERRPSSGKTPGVVDVAPRGRMVRERCVRDPEKGRTVKRLEGEEIIEAHKEWMKTAEAKAANRLRGSVIEPSRATKTRVSKSSPQLSQDQLFTGPSPGWHQRQPDIRIPPRGGPRPVARCRGLGLLRTGAGRVVLDRGMRYSTARITDGRCPRKLPLACRASTGCATRAGRD